MNPERQNQPITGIRDNLMRLGALLLCSSAFAGTSYWDANFTAAGSGNAGATWDGANWTTDPTGSSATSGWVNGDNAVFSAGSDGTGNWTVTLFSSISTPSITFAQTGTKTLNGGAINIGGGAINSTALGFVPNNGDDININSVLGGSGGLTIAGHGDATSNNGGGGGAEFRLGGTNTFSGGLTITSGLVSWSTDANLGDAANVVTLNGGGLLLTGGTLTTPRTIKVGASGGTVRLYGGVNLTCTVPITNATGVASTTLRRTDGGTLMLPAPGPGFVGTFINGGGSTQLTGADADWSSTDFNVAGGNLNLNGTGTAVLKSITNSADVLINNGTTLNVSSGAVSIGAANWYQTTAGTPGKLTSSSGTLDITNGEISGNLTTIDHQIRVQVTDSGITPVALVKNNNNSLVLTQPNTYTGGTTVNGGRLEAQNKDAFGTSSVVVSNGAQAFLTASGAYPNDFVINGSGVPEGAGTFGALRFTNSATVNGSVQVASASRVAATGTGDKGILAGPIIGSAALEKTGSGTVAITGNASGYTGTLTANQGTLQLSNTFGGNLTINDGGFVSGEGVVSGTLTLGSSVGADINVDGATAGALSTNHLTVAGLNYVHLTSLPAVPGTPINVLQYNGTLEMTGTVEDNFVVDGSSAYRNVPTFSNTGSAITLTIPAGDTLVWKGADATNPTYWNTLTTANWKNGTTDPDVFYMGDNVLIDDTGTSKTIALQGMISPGSVTFNNSSGNDYNVTAGGANVFTGPMSLIKNGTGTLTISGAHTFTGGTSVNGGTLKLMSNPTIRGSVTINDGGTIFNNDWAFGYPGNADRVTAITINGGTLAMNSNASENGGYAGDTINMTGGTIQGSDAGHPWFDWSVTSGGGTINTSASSTTAQIITPNVNLRYDNNAARFVLTLNTAAGTTPSGVDLLISGAISSSKSQNAAIVKTGAGVVELSGANTYTGDTTVSAGTLKLASTGSLRFVVADASSNMLKGSATAILDGSFSIDTSAVTVTSGSWTLVDTSTLNETFSATFSPGVEWTESSNVWTKTSGDQLWTFTEATGVLSLSSATSSSYASWIGSFFPGESDPAIIGANADPDRDGIPNAIEMTIGGNPATGMDTALLPSLELVTDPVGVPAGSYFLFIYRRTDSSVTAGLSATCQYDADLIGPWTTATDGVDGVAIFVDDNYGSFVPPAATDTDRVRVYIPRGSHTKLFGRLSVQVP